MSDGATAHENGEFSRDLAAGTTTARLDLAAAAGPAATPSALHVGGGSLGAMGLTGRCLCGGVRFALSEPPQRATYCHCSRCRRRTGTGASVEGRIDAGVLAVVAGEGLVRAYVPAEGWHELFCARCGSALFSRHPEDASIMCVSLGAFDGDPGVRPSRRQFVAYAAAWEPVPDDGLPRFDEAAPPEPGAVSWR